MKLINGFEFILLAMLWGSSFLFLRVASPEFGPVAIIAIRVLIATVCLLPLLIKKQLLPEVANNKSILFWIGLTNSAIPFVLFSVATLELTAGYTSVINATAPLWAAFIGLIGFQLKLSKSAIIGLFIGFSGVLILVWNKLVAFEVDIIWALCAAMTAAMLYGFAVNYSKKQAHSLHPLSVSFGSLAFASISLLPLCLFYWPQQSVSITGWLSVIALGVFCTALAYVLYFKLIKDLGSSNAITVTYFIPFFGSLFGYWFLDEAITGSMIYGGITILVGTGLTMGLIKFKAKA